MENISRDQTRILAMYLPQYHRTPENDEWWGEGYTDWEAVKRSVPLFEGHKQPRLPFNDNYYDLSKKDTLEWQAMLMKEYGVDGICMYHYWFKDGRRVLDKPAENLLEWQDIDMPFCFCWANQTWARTWSNIKGSNPWADNFEKKNEMHSGNDILLEQQYGLEEEWKEHFNYLLRFFQDRRYIRIENKPVIMIYRPLSIPCLLPMLDYWRFLAREAGLDGIYIIGNLTETPKSIHLDAGVTHEPMHSKMLIDAEQTEKQWKYSYDALWANVLQYETREKMFRGAFVNFDDSPRRAYKGFITEGFSVEKFYGYFKRLFEKVHSNGDELFFINAWNEWGEGMCLEPDNWDGFKVLDAVKKAKEEVLASKQNPSCNTALPRGIVALHRNKHSYYTALKADWDELDKKGVNVGQFLEKRGIKAIVIYGIGELGIRLYEDLRRSEVKVTCFADKKPQALAYGIPCVNPEDIPTDVDAVVVSASFFFDEIYEYLHERYSCRIISLKQMVEEAE